MKLILVMPDGREVEGHTYATAWPQLVVWYCEDRGDRLPVHFIHRGNGKYHYAPRIAVTTANNKADNSHRPNANQA